MLWLLLAALVALVLTWERRDLASIGLRRPRWKSLIWGLGTGVALVFVVSPLTKLALQALAPGAYEPGLTRIRASSTPVLIFAGVTAGAVEETLYRGYAIERLFELTGSRGACPGRFRRCARSALGRCRSAGDPAGNLLTLLYFTRRDSPPTVWPTLRLRLHNCSPSRPHGREHPATGVTAQSAVTPTLHGGNRDAEEVEDVGSEQGCPEQEHEGIEDDNFG